MEGEQQASEVAGAGAVHQEYDHLARVPSSLLDDVKEMTEQGQQENDGVGQGEEDEGKHEIEDQDDGDDEGLKVVPNEDLNEAVGQDEGNEDISDQGPNDHQEEVMVSAISATAVAKPDLLLLILLATTITFGLGFISGKWVAENKPRTQQALGVMKPAPADHAGAAQTVIVIPPSFIDFLEVTKTKAIVGVSKDVLVKPQAGDLSAHEFEFRLDGRTSPPQADTPKTSTSDFTPHLRECHEGDEECGDKTASKMERLISWGQGSSREEFGDFLQGPWVD